VAERATGDPTRTHAFGWGRAAPWREDPHVAHLVVAEGPRVDPASIRRGLDRLRRGGYSTVVTTALGPAATLPFLDEGFRVRERLHLLQHDLARLPEPRSPEDRVRKAWRTDQARVLALDARAFEGFWRLDASALRDALEATPSVRFRAGDRAAERADGELAAYAISGRSGRHGYLQRIAVHPDERGRGWGRAVVVDALRWLRRRGTERALVNTQWDNDAALALYRSCGFRRLPAGLSVLERAL
jgi:ribosomal protein S18 acetylase RimI-like enzyme